MMIMCFTYHTFDNAVKSATISEATSVSVFCTLRTSEPSFASVTSQLLDTCGEAGAMLEAEGVTTGRSDQTPVAKTEPLRTTVTPAGTLVQLMMRADII